MTRFFEPISVSAVHVYHSALELSPLSSIVRRLYYHRRHPPFPRVVTGTAESWDQIICLSSVPIHSTYTWSPCGRFIAARADEGVEIRDALSSELLSTLSEPAGDTYCALAYSPDGRSFACLSDTLRIWDIQTGGAVEEIQCYQSSTRSIVWSLDGKAIGMTRDSTVHLYYPGLGAIRSLGTLQSNDELCLWAHGGSFRVMATGWDGGVFTVEIFNIGSNLSKIESFHIKLQGDRPQTGSFSPTTYRISIYILNQLRILDVRSSECLLEGEGDLGFHTFSSDGSLFAYSVDDIISVWRYVSGCYTPWRKFTRPKWTFAPYPIQFSPNSSSILTRSQDLIQVYRLDGTPTVAHPDGSKPLAIISPCGTYIATAHLLGHTVTITNLLSQTTSQFIDTNTEIRHLALTGTILFVFDSAGEQVAAWRLTEGGLVDGVFGDRRAGDGDGIWVARIGDFTRFTVKDSAVVFEGGGRIHAYHTRTGKALEPPQVHPHDLRYFATEMSLGRHYPRYRKADKRGHLPEDNWPVPLIYPRMAWVKDPEGKHRLWVPVRWRTDLAGWHYDIKVLWLHDLDEPVIIRF